MSVTAQPSLPFADLDGGRVTATVDTPAGLQLAGSRCAGCGATAFPRRDVCHRCTGTSLDGVPVGGSGQVYSYTTVRVSGTRPVPYTLGYVDLVGGLRVLGRLVGDGEWQIDERVRIVSTDSGWAFARVRTDPR
jgi:uncharacterized OB-fold protein